MKNNFLIEESPLIEEISDRYTALRNKGKGREKSIEIVREEFHNEFSDVDDGPYAEVALALSLCKKDELTQKEKDNAIHAANHLKERAAEENDPFRQSEYDGLFRYFSEKSIGAEAIYRMRKTYDPGWNIGDTFIHPFSQLAVEKTGLPGWYIVIRKVGEYVNTESRHKQLVYITICPPDKIPKNDEELRALGFLRMMDHTYAWDYLGQLDFKNKKDEERWELQKIGCFPNAGCPDDATIENPFVSMPIFSGVEKNGMLTYEYQVCRLIKSRGIHFGTADN
ncbi:MAG: hypothetical protein IJH48_08090 [Oscillospiraceae bacterium]|nr:hypothetical protein [Oscillospiraceae bacterium]